MKRISKKGTKELQNYVLNLTQQFSHLKDPEELCERIASNQLTAKYNKLLIDLCLGLDTEDLTSCTEEIEITGLYINANNRYTNKDMKFIIDRCLHPEVGIQVKQFLGGGIRITPATMIDYLKYILTSPVKAQAIKTTHVPDNQAQPEHEIVKAMTDCQRDDMIMLRQRLHTFWANTRPVVLGIKNTDTKVEGNLDVIVKNRFGRKYGLLLAKFYASNKVNLNTGKLDFTGLSEYDSTIMQLIFDIFYTGSHDRFSFYQTLAVATEALYNNEIEVQLKMVRVEQIWPQTEGPNQKETEMEHTNKQEQGLLNHLIKIATVGMCAPKTLHGTISDQVKILLEMAPNQHLVRMLAESMAYSEIVGVCPREITKEEIFNLDSRVISKLFQLFASTQFQTVADTNIDDNEAVIKLLEFHNKLVLDWKASSLTINTDKDLSMSHELLTNETLIKFVSETPDLREDIKRRFAIYQVERDHEKMVKLIDDMKSVNDMGEIAMAAKHFGVTHSDAIINPDNRIARTYGDDRGEIVHNLLYRANNKLKELINAEGK